MLSIDLLVGDHVQRPHPVEIGPYAPDKRHQRYYQRQQPDRLRDRCALKDLNQQSRGDHTGDEQSRRNRKRQRDRVDRGPTGPPNLFAIGQVEPVGIGGILTKTRKPPQYPMRRPHRARRLISRASRRWLALVMTRLDVGIRSDKIHRVLLTNHSNKVGAIQALDIQIIGHRASL